MIWQEREKKQKMHRKEISIKLLTIYHHFDIIQPLQISRSIQHLNAMFERLILRNIFRDDWLEREKRQKCIGRNDIKLLTIYHHYFCYNSSATLNNKFFTFLSTFNLIQMLNYIGIIVYF